MKKILLSILIFLSLFFSNSVFGYTIKKNEKILVSGATIGLELETGVKVYGTYGVKEASKIAKPWAMCGIKEGDIILSFNNKPIGSNNDLLKAISEAKGDEVEITFKSNNVTIQKRIKASKKEDGTYSLGLYIKDRVMGVGTLTYVIEDLKAYASLGHSINLDSNITGGNIYLAETKEIVKGTRNKAGEKRASLTSGSIGDIKGNTQVGVYGNYSSEAIKKNSIQMSVAKKEEVKLGPAQILTSLNGDDITLYDVNIVELKNQKNVDIKGIKLEVVDETLILKTGGIIQGMSGSPIIQDNRIVGALTHVSLKDPTTGYGIYIEFMLNEMNISLE